ncbi:hypothetical protein ABW19_dt0205955 [Dactylella cylindrospora]|nr:hypothetical protein ABW19_dt0205955 [Dactylella cylindrospora]
MKATTAIGIALATLSGVSAGPVNYTQKYTWKNVRTGASGGFVTGIVFSTAQEGLAYARTDIGGLYRLNPSDDSWTPLQDYVNTTLWNEHGVDALALDPSDPKRVYIAAGLYTNSWDPYNGKILSSEDYGKTWKRAPFPFKFGGNMAGRQMGERLAVDPNNGKILYFGARSGNGLWKSSDYGKTWAKVTSFTAVGTHIVTPGDQGQNGDIIGLTFVTFDSTSGSPGTGSSRIFVGTADSTATVYVSEDSGATWSAIPGQPTGFLSHTGKYSPTEKALYVSYVNNANTYGGEDGYVYKYYVVSKTWVKILDDNGTGFGFGGLSLDPQKNGTVMVATYHQWWPDGNIYRSLDGGATWTTIWDFDWSGVQPPVKRRYDWDVSDANWLPETTGDKWTGWMMGSLAIDPFDSDHFLYGTGATVFGSHELTNWDTNTKFTLSSLSYGMEETAVLGLTSPPSGPSLLSVVGDVGGWRHENLDVAPNKGHLNPTWGTTRSIDHAGSKPNIIVRSGDGSGGLAISNDTGVTWHVHASAGSWTAGRAQLSANGDFVVWAVNNALYVSANEEAFVQVPGIPSGSYNTANDRKHNGLFYAAETNNFYVSTDAGTSYNKTSSSLGWIREIGVNPFRIGDVWVATDTGIWHSIDSGKTFGKVGPATDAYHVQLGKAAVNNGYPAIFAAATIQGWAGHYRSDDGGYTWTLISDDQNGFGTPGNNIYAADPRIYGRVYIGTNGRGIFYGDASATSPVPAAADVYGQCGGSGWTGPKTCPHGWTCKVTNAYYSQCT